MKKFTTNSLLAISSTLALVAMTQANAVEDSSNDIAAQSMNQQAQPSSNQTPNSPRFRGNGQHHGAMMGQGGYGNMMGQGQYDNMGQGGSDNMMGQGQYGNMGQGGYGNMMGQGGYGNMMGQGGYGNMMGQGAYGNMMGQGGYGGMMSSAMSQLNLSKEQRNQISAIMQAQHIARHSERRANFAERQQQQEQIQALIDSPTLDTEALDKLADEYAEQAKQHFIEHVQTQYAISQVFTDDQRAQLKQWRNERAENNQSRANKNAQ